MTAKAPSLQGILAALVASHDAMASFTALEDSALTGPSFCSKWTIAQVLSHLGSGAEIGILRLHAALDNVAPPQLDELRAIWDRWDMASPREQAQWALKEDARYLEMISRLDEGQANTARTQILGSEASIHDLLAFRLLEHTLHVWDMQVPGDPEAVLPQNAVELLLDPLAMLASRIAKVPEDGSGKDLDIHVKTVNPESLWQVTASDSEISVERLDPAINPQALVLPAETWIRLAAGRLKASEQSGELRELAKIFPGY
jgi:uncharacterized protein (TIGR03083 family)